MIRRQEHVEQDDEEGRAEIGEEGRGREDGRVKRDEGRGGNRTYIT